jgi:hypothetical protein
MIKPLLTIEVKQKNKPKECRSLDSGRKGLYKKLVNLILKKRMIILHTTDDFKTKSELLFIFATLVIVNEQGFPLVLQSLNHVKFIKRSKTRFDYLVGTISESKEESYLRNLFLFFNSLLKQAPTTIIKRQFQKEFLDTKIMELMDKLISDADPFGNLFTHLNIFNQFLSSSEGLENLDIDTISDINVAFKVLSSSVEETENHPRFLGIICDILKTVQKRNQEE